MLRVFVGWLAGAIAAVIVGATFQPDGLLGFLAGYALPLLGAVLGYVTQATEASET